MDTNLKLILTWLARGWLLVLVAGVSVGMTGCMAPFCNTCGKTAYNSCAQPRVSSCPVRTCGSSCCSRSSCCDPCGGNGGVVGNGAGYPSRPVDPVVLSVVGYGAPDPAITSPVQRQLMAMRASEVDAMRRLAEQVKGVQVSGTTKVEDFMTEHDHVRTIVNAWLKRAKMGTHGFTRAGYYETTLTLTLDQGFFDQMAQADNSGFAASQPVEMDEPLLSDADSPLGAATLSGQQSHYDLGGTQQ